MSSAKTPATVHSSVTLRDNSSLLRGWPRWTPCPTLSGAHAMSIVFTTEKAHSGSILPWTMMRYTLINLDKVTNRYLRSRELRFSMEIQNASKQVCVVAMTKAENRNFAVTILRLFCLKHFDDIVSGNHLVLSCSLHRRAI